LTPTFPLQFVLGLQLIWLFLLLLLVMLLQSELMPLLLWGLLATGNVVIRVAKASVGLTLCFESVTEFGVVFLDIELFVPILFGFMLSCCVLAR
jgi:hypothetical protein